MKADIESQIKNNNEIITYSMIYGPEMFELTERDISNFKRRNVFLKKVLNAQVHPVCEVDQKTINFVYQR